MHVVYNQQRDLGPDDTYQFLFKNGDFFPPVWPIVHTYPVKTVTENALYRKRSPELRFLKTRLIVYLWTDENCGFRIR